MLGPFLVAPLDPGDVSGELSRRFPGSKPAPLLAPVPIGSRADRRDFALIDSMMDTSA